jgi:hypothetical protein
MDRFDESPRLRRALEILAVAWTLLAAPPARAQAPPQAPPPRDGGSASYELRAELTGVFYPTQSFPVLGTCETGTGVVPVSVYGRTSGGPGIGGGPSFGARAAYMHFFLPKRRGDSPWFALRFGAGLDFGIPYGHVATGVAPASGDLCAKFEKDAHAVDYADDAMLMLQAPLNAGVHVGIGGYRSQTSWRGIVLGVAWTPTFDLIKPWTQDARPSVSWLGVELTLDFTTLDTRVDHTPQQQLRLSIMLLPGMQQGAPFIATLGLGAAWY